MKRNTSHTIKRAQRFPVILIGEGLLVGAVGGHQSKKVYNRRKIKAADKKLPYFFVFKIASLSSRHSDTIQ